MRVLIAGFAALAAAPAFAAEAGEGGLTPFAGDFGTALWTLLIFGIVVFILGRYAWKPVLGGLQARERFIRDSLEEARRDRTEAQARLKEYSERLDRARAEASGIVDEARRDAEAVKRRIESEAAAEANRTIVRARREIELAKEGAVKELYAVSARLTTELAGKILRREISPADHERLIRESIDRLAGGAH